MITMNELVQAIALLETEALQRWIDNGWVLPVGDDNNRRFDDSDVARVHLICELHYELQIDEDSLSVVLSLLDQLYATRRSLQALVSAVAAQPENVRARIGAMIKLT